MNTFDESKPVSQPSTLNHQLSFSLAPGESPRASSAFMTFFQLGHGRSLRAVADQLDMGIDAIKKWSSRFDWNDRIHSFNAEILQQQMQAEVASQSEQVAEWSARMAALREQQWAAAQKLLAVVQCYLENFGDEQLEKMTLSHATRALVIASKIARMALAGIEHPEKSKPELSPSQPASNSPYAADVPQNSPPPAPIQAPQTDYERSEHRRLTNPIQQPESCILHHEKSITLNQIPTNSSTTSPFTSSASNARQRKNFFSSVVWCRSVPTSEANLPTQELVAEPSHASFFSPSPNEIQINQVNDKVIPNMEKNVEKSAVRCLLPGRTSSTYNIQTRRNYFWCRSVPFGALGCGLITGCARRDRGKTPQHIIFRRGLVPFGAAPASISIF